MARFKRSVWGKVKRLTSDESKEPSLKEPSSLMEYSSPNEAVTDEPCRFEHRPESLEKIKMNNEK